jgi:N-formylglutamate amidohydrolase
VQLSECREEIDRLVVDVIREADVDRSSVTVYEWVLVDTDLIGNSSLRVRCESLTLSRRDQYVIRLFGAGKSYLAEVRE